MPGGQGNRLAQRRDAKGDRQGADRAGACDSAARGDLHRDRAATGNPCRTPPRQGIAGPRRGRAAPERHHLSPEKGRTQAAVRTAAPGPDPKRYPPPPACRGGGGRGSQAVRQGNGSFRQAGKGQEGQGAGRRRARPAPRGQLPRRPQQLADVGDRVRLNGHRYTCRQNSPRATWCSWSTARVAATRVF